MIPGDGSEIAERHLAHAERLLGPRASGDDLAMLRRLQAMAATRARDYVRAEDFGQRALEFAADLPSEAGAAWRTIAEARAAAGDPGADEAFRQAVDLLHEHGTVRDYASVLRAYGRFLREVGRDHEAMEIFERAANVASNIHGEPSAAERDAR